MFTVAYEMHAGGGITYGEPKKPMKPIDLQNAKDFVPNPAASGALIIESETRMGTSLPHDFVEFLRIANGGEGPIGSSGYLVLWPLERLDEFNRAYQTTENAPGLLLFGSDGGGEAFGFDLADPATPVVRVPFVGMDRSVVDVEAPTFTDFFQKLAGS